MDQTLDILPGEGDIETVTRRRRRHECGICGAPAHYKHTFLPQGARSNPASSAFGRDDCSWCGDACQYVCREHLEEGRETPPRGMCWCSTFPASERFKHLFLYWEDEKT